MSTPETASQPEASNRPTDDTEAKLRDYLKRVTADLRQVRRRLREVESQAWEPIAIVGMACRYPGGVTSPEDLWRVVADGADVISDFPADRGWDVAGVYHPDPDHPGTSYTRSGGFLRDPGVFDAGFFGISPREALAMAPQQRLLLETSWEAVETAGIDPATLRGTPVGVFFGASNHDYGLGPGAADLQGHLVTGSSSAVMSGRVAYTLDLTGPAVTVDTMCSSSLVAIHLAGHSLRQGECTLALVGGVAVLATTGAFVEFSRQRALSPDGHCRAFSASADGTGWSEGAGVLLLERLGDAQRNGHPIWGVISGSAINQDGASNGLTAPNGVAQQQVIRQALKNAQLGPEDVDAVEAHGTGTPLGDPIEANALLATYGQERDADHPLWLGSLKSNLGHAQAASGVGGVIKTVMALRHRTLPKTLHAAEPSRKVDWSSGAVRLLNEARPWPDRGRPRRAGVSSFGASGTNAHLIVEEPPAAGPATGSPGGHADAATPEALAWVLAAHTGDALRAQARRLGAYLVERPTLDPLDVGFSLATGRTAFEHRAVVLGADRAGLLDGLNALASGEPAGAVVTGRAPEERRPVMVFPGQGSQWAGMAAALLETSPVFRDRAEECAQALAPHLDWPVTDTLRGAPGTPPLDRVDVVQPLLFTVMVSLAALWRSYGVEPAAVIGHSQGEAAAACVAGALSLEDAARVVAVRSRMLHQEMVGRGGMAGLSVPAERAETLIKPWSGRLCVAAVNGPASVVVSGDDAALDELIAHCEDTGIRARRVRVDYASHSPQIGEDFQKRLRRALAGITARASSVPLYSTVTGALLDAAAMDAGYWARNLRQPVLFQAATLAALADGHRAFVEVSPHPVLTLAVAETADAGDVPDVRTIGTLRRDDGGRPRLLASLAEAHVAGVTPAWQAEFEARGAIRVELPTYAFQGERYWLEPGHLFAPGAVRDAGEDAFWAAVDAQDPQALAALLDADDEMLAPVLPSLAAWQRRRAEGAALDALRYRAVWEPVVRAAPSRLAGRWLVAFSAAQADDERVAAHLRGLAAAGAEIVPLRVDPAAADRGPVTAALRGAGPGPAGVGFSGLVSLLALDTAPHRDRPELTAGLAATALLVQAMDDTAAEYPLWLVTHGAVSAGCEATSEPHQSAVWGLGRCVALEHPARWGGLVDLPAEADAAAIAALGSLLADAAGEDQLAIRPEQTFRRRIERAPRPAAAAGRSWQPRGTVLITGGTGGLGAHLARWFAGRGVEHIALLSRRGAAAEGTEELRAQLRDAGARVTIVSCDVADRQAVADAVARVEADGDVVRTVVHAAGAGVLAPVAETNLHDIGYAFPGKVLGAANLDAVFADRELDAFVLFSSISGTWGSRIHGAYAAANAYLDGLAERRRAAGQAGTSIVWGVWDPEAGGGMAVGLDESNLRAQGVGLLDPAVALTELGHAVAGGETVLIVAEIDWDTFVPVFTATGRRPLLDGVTDVRAILAADGAGHRAGSASGDVGGALRTSLAGRSAADRDRILLDLVRTQMAIVLGHDGVASIEPARAFSDLGVDSLTAVDLRNRLSAVTGLRLPATLVFDHPSALDLAAFLAGELAGGGAASRAAAPAVVLAASDEPIAIVAMSCRLPGGVDSPEALWTALTNGADLITDIPSDRGWEIDGLYDPDSERSGTTYTRRGGFLTEAGHFDPAFFGISPREALAMDPQQRLLLTTSWEALERAGIDPAALRGSRAGVFIGAAYQGYGNAFGALPDGTEGHLVTGISSSVLSGRIAYTLGLEGPALTVDTACSSSLVALHLACQSLRRGESSLALVGGATVLGTPLSFVEYSRQRGLAPDGRCKAFGDAADGFGLAEGVSMLLVERLSDARRAGHEVLALVRGTAVNQDGASNGLTAPNGLSQQRVIRAALADAGLAPAEVDVVEAHGTGTRLGDPIEAQAVLATYGQDRAAERPLLLGALKSNTGHTQAASGAAGIIKMVLAMRHGRLPRTLYADVPTTEVDWSSGAVRLVTEATDWPDDTHPRRAGVSAFGMSGTNAHTVIEQAPAATPDETTAAAEPAQPRPVAGWTLSARDDAALRAQARRLLDHVTERELDPADVGYSLAATRTAFEHRAVIVGADRAEFAAALGALGRGRPHPALERAKAVSAGQTAFVFSGEGAAWPGMGAELLDTSPVFAARMAECAAALAPWTDWNLLDGVRSTGPHPLAVAQPVQWAIAVSLAELWRSFGVVPDAVVGHSRGELAAAVVAGAVSLAEGAGQIARRARVLAGSDLPGRGAMAAVGLPETEIAPYLGEGVWLAAVNGPVQVVLSGSPAAIEHAAGRLRADGVPVQVVDSGYASHSGHIAALANELDGGASFDSDALPWYSTVTGALVAAGELDGGYWYRNLRQTVRFQPAVRALLDDGYRTFVEVSAIPVLLGEVAQTAYASGVTDTVCVGSLRRDDGGLTRMVRSAGQLWAGGGAVDRTAVAGPGRVVGLPTYPFQEQRFWLESAVPAAVAAAGTAAGPSDGPFWDAVRHADVDALAAAAGVDGDAPRESLRSVLPLLSSWMTRAERRSVADGWQYRVVWRPLPDAEPASLDGTWLLAVPDAGDAGPVAEAVAAALAVRGARAVTVSVGDGHDRAALAARLREAAAGAVPRAVLSLADDDTTQDETVPAGFAATVTLLQALADADLGAPCWLLTRGAVAVGRSDAVARPAQALAWGLGRIAGVEYPQWWGGLADLPETVDQRAADRLVCAVSAGGTGAAAAAENQIAVRSSGAYAARLVRSVPRETGRDAWRPRGTVVVTGGTGGVGSRVARWLAGLGAEHLLLLSRRGAAAEGAAELAADLATAGAGVTMLACDVADRDALAAALASVPADRPVSAVFHLAGVVEDGVIDTLDAGRSGRVLGPKVLAARHLAELTRGADLSAFVLFSSFSGTLGGPGQAAYAAANAYLDALAGRLRADGVPATSIAWGLWGGGVIAADLAASLRRRGLPPMDQELALDVLHRAVGGDAAAVVVADIEWDRLVDAVSVGRDYAILDELPEARRAAGPAGPAGESALAAQLAGLHPAERDRYVDDLVRAEVAAVLGYADPGAVDPDRALKDLGFDSMAGVELRNRLGTVTGLPLPVTLVFDYPTGTSLAQHLRGQLAGLIGSGGPIEAAPGSTAAAVPGPAAGDDPIVIVAMSCRYPGGADTPENLWRLVAAGTDAVSEFPTDRGWDLDGGYDPDPEHVGTFYATAGGFLYDAADFDAGFFGMSPREALATDPQQRLLLEVAWEAIERAGIAPTSLRGSPTGVFVGSSYHDYGMRAVNAPEGVEGYLGIGSTGSVVSGRIAYVLGLEGPAVTIDTACSSSLVAMHLAAQALRQGECGLALAGGVSVMSTMQSFVEFSRQRGLAADGRCKPFAAQADGTGWAEGAGLVLLERLSDARRNGHPVLAVVRGSAVNQDGASNGLTAPSGPAQQRVIRAALASAGLSAADVDAVEAHGTGTRLGDPIEAQALLATYGREHSGDRPLWLGSVKSNIGHAQAAAGVAGVIKMTMALGHELLPSTLHIDEPTPHVDWSGGLRLLTEPVPWPQNGHSRRAAVSAFGVSGTNAHVILERAPDDPPVAPEVPAAPGVPAPGDPAPGVPVVRDRPVPWPLSGGTAAALRDQARRLLGAIERRPDWEPAEVAGALATSRATLEYRAVVAGGPAELTAGLAALAVGEPHPAVVTGRQARPGRTAFLLSGQGSQRPGMGRDLYAAFPAFAAALDEVCAQFDLHVDRPLRDLLFAEPESAEAGLLGQTAYTQPALFAFEVAMFRLLESWGVLPDVLLGHSVGELAAAHLAGVLTLADACALVATRGRLIQAVATPGAMVSVRLSEAEVTTRLAKLDGAGERVVIAAVNGPRATVIAGDEDAVAALARAWEDEGLRPRRLRVSHAFHSPHMDGMLAEFGRVAEGVAYGEPRIAVVSNLTGVPVARFDAGYWVRHAREAVRFADGVRYLDAQGVTAFVEIGPDGALTAMAAQCLPDGDAAPLQVAAARRNERESATVLRAAAALYVHGARIDWTAALPDGPRRHLDLPTYPFQRQRYWLEDTGPAATDVASAGLDDVDHPLLAAVLELPERGTAVFTGRLSARTHPWLSDHTVGSAVVVPATAMLELALCAGDRLGTDRVAELTLHAPLALPAGASAQLQLTVDAPDSETGQRPFELHARTGDAPWTRHASGALTADTAQAAPAADTAWPPDGAEPLETEGLYQWLADGGVSYGPAFRGIRAAWRQGDDVLVEVALPDDLSAAASRFGLHPALFDAAFHGTAFGLLEQDGAARVPFSWNDVALHASGATELRVRLRPEGRDTVSMTAADPAGRTVVTVGSLALRPVAPASTGPAAPPLLRLDWPDIATPAPAADGSWALIGADPLGLGGAGHADLATLGQALDAGLPAPALLLTELAGPAGPSDLPGAVRGTVAAALETVRGLLADDRLLGTRLVFLTRGAVAVGGGDVADLAAAAAWGLVRSAQTENPDRFLLVDLDPGDPDAPALVPAAIATALRDEESQVLIRSGRLLAGRITALPRDDAEAAPWDPAGTVLVTGATGMIGAHVCRHLVAEHGVRHLLLLSRRGAAAPGAAELTAELTARGAAVTFAACDAADHAELRRVLGAVPAKHPLTAVVHTAGVLDDGPISALTPDRLGPVLRPKVDAVVNLHELTADAPLAAFVLFSSTAGVFGGVGQANYAAGNAFLDAFAARRRAAGRPAVALAWGMWAADGGMVGRLTEADLARLARGGFVPMPVEECLALFDAALASDNAALIPLRLDTRALRSGDVRVPPLLRGLVPARTRRAASTGADPGQALRARLGALAGPERDQAVVELVAAQAALVLGYTDPALIDPERGFMDMGFDSLTVVEMRNRLAAATGLRLPATLLFDYPTAVAVAGYLLDELAPAESAAVDLADLDRIESRLPELLRDERGRARLLNRLQNLVMRVRDDADGETVANLDEASDNEIFALLDSELDHGDA